MNRFFFDTYALIEIYKKSLRYNGYKEDVGMILTKLNILEFTHFLIREGKENEVEEVFTKLSSFCVRYDDKILIESAKMKFKFSKEKLSFIDCIGYNLAKRYKVRFLTGDEKFKNKENVEFVK
ncbi:MAG: PIN domain-containing protein [Nanoarchaeota archaeon]